MEVEKLNIRACNDHLSELLEMQERLTQGVLNAVHEWDYERARLFSHSAERCAKNVSSFLNSMMQEKER